MDVNRTVRLVCLGSTGVGKTSLLKRFLLNTFPDKPKPTVEDLYTKTFAIGVEPRLVVKCDMLDTAGDPQFPAMRRLSITTSHAFLLVYAVDDKQSFEQIKSLIAEIREHRPDFHETPVIIAGNKADVPAIKRDVEFDEVCDWVHDNIPKFKGKAMECSAKAGRNVREIFKTFLQLSQMCPSVSSTEEPSVLFGGGLRRRSSAYAGTNAGRSVQAVPATPPATSCSSPKIGLGLLRGTVSTPSSVQFDFESSGLSKNKPRSRSLIRRSSKKGNPQTRDTSNGNPGDCTVT